MIRFTMSKFIFMVTVIAVSFCSVSFSQGTKFIHVATDSNINLNWTVIDNPALNENPNAIIFITQNWNPGGDSIGVYNSSAVGVWYNGSNWAIFNEDQSPMSVGAAFNVLIPTGGQTFVHRADSTNTLQNYTVIDNASLTGNPNAIFFVTQDWDPSGLGNVFNNSEIGVWYYIDQHWYIINENSSNMPYGAAFNILLPVTPDKFIHVAADSNTFLNWTRINNPALNGNPNAIFFVTPNVNPENVYDASSIGVWYNGSKWTIFNENRSIMTLGTAFNIYLAEGGMTGADIKNDLKIQNFNLEQNYPNPFNPNTTIEFSLPENAQNVRVSIFNSLGQKVTELVNGPLLAGKYQYQWNANTFASGMYIYELRTEKFVSAKKMILLK